MSHGRLIEEVPAHRALLRPTRVRGELSRRREPPGRQVVTWARVGDFEGALPGRDRPRGGRTASAGADPPGGRRPDREGAGGSGAELGEGEVEEVAFAGAGERLRVRLSSARRTGYPAAAALRRPRLAARCLSLAARRPLAEGAKVRVGVRRVHALLHPGLAMLCADDASPASESARTSAAQSLRLEARLDTVTAPSRLPEAVAERLMPSPPISSSPRSRPGMAPTMRKSS